MNCKAIQKITTHAEAARALKERLCVKDRTLREARANGYFSASWYPIVSDICKEYGLDCPMDAFNFKAPMAGAK